MFCGFQKHWVLAGQKLLQQGLISVAMTWP